MRTGLIGLIGGVLITGAIWGGVAFFGSSTTKTGPRNGAGRGGHSATLACSGTSASGSCSDWAGAGGFG